MTFNSVPTHKRTAQFDAVWDCMADGQWRTLGQISAEIGFAPTQSISARLRDFRKQKFGGHIVVSRLVGHHVYEYRLLIKSSKAA
jgi:hypothetical protein